ncbi:MAG: CheY-like chemotaxis protein [Pseudohongiellaceae bacterium]|jgi:CheY-like chemotaxis protein
MAVETALVVDDSKSARIMLSRMVKKTGLEVEMVESGEGALERLKSGPYPDVIFMDHMMPGMDGLQTTKQITSNTQTSHIPIFMYTSKEGPAYEAEVEASGASGMLGKPAKPERLLEVIAELNERIANAPPVTQSDPTPFETPEKQETLSLEATQTTITENTPEPEEEEMSKELIEEVSARLVARAIEDALQPVSGSINRLETHISENQSDIRKISSRLDQNQNLVSQSVLDASLKQTTVQLQNLITGEIKSIRDLLEKQAELSPATLNQIKDIASKSGSESGATTAEKTAKSAAEAVAAKVGAAQAQIQVMQDMEPIMRQAKKANVMAFIAILVAGAAITSAFLI